MGRQVVVKSAVGERTSGHIIRRVRVLQHAEYLGANIFSLSRSGNKGWYVQPDIRFDARGGDEGLFEIETTEIVEDAFEYVSMDEDDDPSGSSSKECSILMTIMCSYIAQAHI